MIEYQPQAARKAVRDEQAVRFFEERLAREGSNVTLASYETMEKFGIGAIQTIYNIRRRVKRRQAEAEKKNADV